MLCGRRFPFVFFLFFLINQLNFMAHNTKGNNLTVTVNYRLIIVLLCAVIFPLCAFSELVPAYDSSTFVLVNFR